MKTIFKFCAISFLMCGILFPTYAYIANNIVPNSEKNLIYVNGELKGSEILNQKYSSELYFSTNNIRPYITIEEVERQKPIVMKANNLDEETIDELIKRNTYNNLYFEYVNITTLNIQIYEINH